MTKAHIEAELRDIARGLDRWATRATPAEQKQIEGYRARIAAIRNHLGLDEIQNDEYGGGQPWARARHCIERINKCNSNLRFGLKTRETNGGIA